MRGLLGSIVISIVASIVLSALVSLFTGREGFAFVPCIFLAFPLGSLMFWGANNRK